MNNTDPLVGQVVDGRYEVVRRLARGGMATVYLASDRRLTRTVALKVLHDHLGADADFTARFDREARAAARLSHPNVVSVFDQGMDGGRPYIVMEYVEGSTLRHLITAEAPMAPDRAMDLLLPIVAAVAAAHEAGIIHRDLKPENVLIAGRGQVKVADFGLARAVTAQTATAQGMLIGTVSYIAPELVTNGPADTRCDIYALGVLMYEMLTGQKPHTGETPIQVAYSHVHNEVGPPSKVAPGSIPDYLDALVMAAAARDPQARPADATVLLDHLHQARDALLRGVTGDPLLAARLRETTIDPASQVTEHLPTFPDESEVERSTTLVFTPVNPSQPSVGGEPAGLVPGQERRFGVADSETRKRPGRLVALLVILGLVLGVGGWYLFAGRFTSTPDFTGSTREEAAAIALNNGLQLSWAEDFSETVPVGQVVRTDPATGGQVARGGTVTAYLSKGPERYPVPSLVGRTTDDAVKALSEARLKQGRISEVFHETAPIGTVVGSSIEPGKLVKPDTAVDLEISKGPAPVKIVSFVDKPFAAAETYFRNAGLVVQRGEDKFSSKIAAGNVISSDPAKGSVDKGATITFIVSKGPEMVTVPDVRGLSESEASSRLKGAGFKVKVERNFFGRTAWGTNPGEGRKVPKGSTVVLILV